MYQYTCSWGYFHLALLDVHFSGLGFLQSWKESHLHRIKKLHAMDFLNDIRYCSNWDSTPHGQMGQEETVLLVNVFVNHHGCCMYISRVVGKDSFLKRQHCKQGCFFRAVWWEGRGGGGQPYQLCSKESKMLFASVAQSAFQTSLRIQFTVV